MTGLFGGTPRPPPPPPPPPPLPPVAPLPDPGDERLKALSRRKAAGAASRSGRISTILSDGGEKLGG